VRCGNAEVERLTLKVWFVTGASGGFGQALTRAALSEGHRVAAAARDVTSLRGVAEEFGDAVLPVELDVTDRGAVASAVERCYTHFHGLDVVVNNAGAGLIGAIEETGEDEARAIFEVNFFGALWVTQAALPYLRAQGSGRIVQVSSVAGLVGFPMIGFYCASKWALEGLSETLAQEVARFGIKVTLVEPGAMRTEWAHRSMGRVAGPERHYAPELQARLEAMQVEYGHRQRNDPVRAAGTLVRALHNADPPRRLVMGSDAFEAVMSEYQLRVREWSMWEAETRATDFPY
jgi:NAD(P)-dependent dehydrogenase (short-subunit alcohol dehydrogenase family)